MKTKLITREGYNRLRQEHDMLWREERPDVTKKVAWAASLGDRSENADYHYNKKLLREIDGVTADRELDRRAQLRQRKKLHQQKDNDTQHKANFALGDLKRLLFRFHLPTFLVGGAPNSQPCCRLKRGARYRTPLTLRCVAAIQSSGFFG